MLDVDAGSLGIGLAEAEDQVGELAEAVADLARADPPPQKLREIVEAEVLPRGAVLGRPGDIFRRHGHGAPLNRQRD